MARSFPPLNSAVAAILLALASPAGAEEHLQPLYDALREASGTAADEIAQKIWEEWSKSGSPAMDLLLERGREAIAVGDPERAVQHLSVLVEQAPGFAEGWNARATAYFQLGQYTLALSDIRRTLALNPQHFGALAGLAVILEELGYEPKALEAWRAVEAIYPTQPEVGLSVQRLSRVVEGEAL